MLRRAALLLLSLLLAAACPLAAGAQDAAPAAAAVAAAGAAPAEYILGPGDKLRVIVFGEENLSGEFSVSGTGLVSLPLIAPLRGVGLTVSQFQDSVRLALADGYLRDPRVSVEVLNYRPFYILGEVTKPGEYPFASGLTVRKAVAAAGGFTYRANTKDVWVKHATESVEHKVRLSPDFAVLPGDTLRIGERFF